jgi:hypothetical protein
VTGCIAEVLVLLVTSVHQSGECVVVEQVEAARLFRFPYVGSEAAAAIRALVLVFFTIVVKDASANLGRIRVFFMWHNVLLDVANFARCDAVTTRSAEAWRVERAMVVSEHDGGRHAVAASS